MRLLYSTKKQKKGYNRFWKQLANNEKRKPQRDIYGQTCGGYPKDSTANSLLLM